MEIAWKLREYLDTHNLTPLTVETRAGLGRNSIYRLMRGTGPERLDRSTLARLIGTLRDLTGELVTPNDLLEVVTTPEPAPALDEAAEALALAAFNEGALLDLSDRLAELEKGMTPEERAAWDETLEKGVTPGRYEPGRGFVPLNEA